MSMKSKHSEEELEEEATPFNEVYVWGGMRA